MCGVVKITKCLSIFFVVSFSYNVTLLYDFLLNILILFLKVFIMSKTFPFTLFFSTSMINCYMIMKLYSDIGVLGGSVSRSLDCGNHSSGFEPRSSKHFPHDF